MEQQRSNTPAGGQLTCSTLSLMVPTLRLMSAFAWQVVQHCNVMHYGKVEELVQLVSEVVPDLLSLREKVDLLLGLRAMAATSGPVSATDLQTLVWEFISRLDKLLPLPDIKQTAELLGAAPSLLEECGQLEFEPAQLKTLLDHHTQQDNAIECSLAQTQSLDIHSLWVSAPQSKAQQDCSDRTTMSGRKVKPPRTKEDKDGQSDDHTYNIEEEDDAMGKQSDEEWLPFTEDCSPTRVEPRPAALMTQAEPSSPHAQVATAVSKNNSMTWWTSNFTRKKKKTSYMARHFGDTLCELVRNHPHLYDEASPLRRTHLLSTWDDISRALKLGQKECRLKWKAIRDRFVKASKKDPEKRTRHDLANIQRLAWLSPYLKTRLFSAMTNVPIDDMAPELPSAQEEPSSHAQVDTATAVSKKCRKKKYFIMGEGFIDRLCELVRNHPNLYDATSPLHGTQYSYATWDVVGKALQLGGQECRRKWKYIRDRFVKAVRKDPEQQSGRDEALIQRLTWLIPHLQLPPVIPNYDMAPELPRAPVAISKKNMAPGFSNSLCELVRNQPHLYDTLSPLHTMQHCNTTWKDVGRAFNLSGEECRRKFKSIRDQFVRISRKRKKSQRDLERIQRLAWLKPYIKIRTNVPKAPELPSAKPSLLESVVSSWVQSQRTNPSTASSPQSQSVNPIVKYSGKQLPLLFQPIVCLERLPQSKAQQDCSDIKKWTRSGSKLLPQGAEEDKDGQSDHSVEEEDGAEGKQIDENCTPSTQVEPDTDAWITQPEPAGAHIAARRRRIGRCSFCGLRTGDLKRHMGTHTRPFPCDHCDKRFPTKSTLALHMLFHTDERPYQCTYCGRGFNNPGTLVTHERTHTHKQCYTCHICGKMSVQSHTHKRHMLTHEGEKQYLCTECGKVFANSGELNRHTRYHTGEKPYPCKLCGKSFTVTSSLTVHMRSHTGEKPYSCIHCPKAFATSNARKLHMYIHFGKKPFECSKCGKGFAQGYLRKNHIKSGKCKKY